jgi:hypothetical protein
MDNRKMCVRIFLLTLTLTLTACSSSTSSLPSSGTVSHSLSTGIATPAILDVCALVSTDEMAKIVGQAMTSQPKTLQTGIPACNYKNGTGNPIPAVTIAIHKPNGKSTYTMAQTMYKKTAGYQEVSGIGEQAFDSNDGAFYAMKGDSCLDVVITQDPKIRFDQLKQIATIAIGRMP